MEEFITQISRVNESYLILFSVRVQVTLILITTYSSVTPGIRPLQYLRRHSDGGGKTIRICFQTHLMFFENPHKT